MRAVSPAEKGGAVIAGVQGYWELAAAGPRPARAAVHAVAPDNSAMAASSAFLPGAIDKDVALVIMELTAWAPEQSSRFLEAMTTDGQQISLEWSDADFVRP